MKADARRCADAVSINEQSFRQRQRWKKQVDEIFFAYLILLIDKSQVLNQTVVIPCMYVINSTSLAKINAFMQVTVDAKSIDADIIIVMETWLKAKRAADAFVIPGFICIRKDRIK